MKQTKRQGDAYQMRDLNKKIKACKRYVLWIVI